jgi:hypothetical protein
MAEVEFSREEAGSGRLPRVCMKCGAPATEVIDRNYTTDHVDAVPPPDAVGCLILGPILGLLKIISMSNAKTMTVQTPVCDKHAKGWFTKANFTAMSITDERIKLTGVSEEFAKAWQQQRLKASPRESGLIKIRCRGCQALNDESAKFCNQCGAVI